MLYALSLHVPLQIELFSFVHILEVFKLPYVNSCFGWPAVSSFRLMQLNSVDVIFQECFNCDIWYDKIEDTWRLYAFCLSWSLTVLVFPVGSVNGNRTEENVRHSTIHPWRDVCSTWKVSYIKFSKAIGPVRFTWSMLVQCLTHWLMAIAGRKRCRIWIDLPTRRCSGLVFCLFLFAYL